MARGINKVILIATAGNDAEVRFMASGAAVANVSLATNEEWTDKQTGQKQSRVEWHRVTFMDRGNFRLGQIAGDFIKKGSKVYVEGSLRTREWEKDGIKRYTTEIVANDMQLLDSRSDDSGQQSGGGYGNENQQQAPAQQGFNTPKGRQSYGAIDSWGGYVPCGKAEGQPIGAVKNHPSIKGDLQKAIHQGLVHKPEANKQQAPKFDDFDDDIPF
jgi:single-strand DNA-binding protein